MLAALGLKASSAGCSCCALLRGSAAAAVGGMLCNCISISPLPEGRDLLPATANDKPEHPSPKSSLPQDVLVVPARRHSSNSQSGRNEPFYPDSVPWAPR